MAYIFRSEPCVVHPVQQLVERINRSGFRQPAVFRHSTEFKIITMIFEIHYINILETLRTASFHSLEPEGDSLRFRPQLPRQLQHNIDSAGLRRQRV